MPSTIDTNAERYVGNYEDDNYNYLNMINAYKAGASDVIELIKLELNKSQERGELGDTLRKNLREFIVKLEK